MQTINKVDQPSVSPAKRELARANPARVRLEQLLRAKLQPITGTLAGGFVGERCGDREFKVSLYINTDNWVTNGCNLFCNRLRKWTSIMAGFTTGAILTVKGIALLTATAIPEGLVLGAAVGGAASGYAGKRIARAIDRHSPTEKKFPAFCNSVQEALSFANDFANNPPTDTNSQQDLARAKRFVAIFTLFDPAALKEYQQELKRYQEDNPTLYLLETASLSMMSRVATIAVNYLYRKICQ